MLTDSNGYIRMVNLTEFYATGTYIYNDSSQSNYTTFNPYTFIANTSNWTGTNTTNVVSSETVVIMLVLSSFTQTNYSWNQSSNFSVNYLTNWSRFIYTTGSGIANASLLQNRTGSLWLLNESGSYHDFLANGSDWATWKTYNNISQNWTVIMQSTAMKCRNITKPTWSTRSNATLCEIYAPLYTAQLAEALIQNQSQIQQIWTCQGLGTGTGNDCDVNNIGVWTGELGYVQIGTELYRSGGEPVIPIVHYLLVWDAFVAFPPSGGGEAEPSFPPQVINETEEEIEPQGPEPSTAGLIFGSASKAWNFFIRYVQDNAPATLILGTLLMIGALAYEEKIGIYAQMVVILSAIPTIIAFLFLTGGLA